MRFPTPDEIAVAVAMLVAWVGTLGLGGMVEDRRMPLLVAVSLSVFLGTIVMLFAVSLGVIQ